MRWRRCTFMSAMIQQPRVPSSGQMPASDVIIRAKEVWFPNFLWLFQMLTFFSIKVQEHVACLAHGLLEFLQFICFYYMPKDHQECVLMFPYLYHSSFYEFIGLLCSLQVITNKDTLVKLLAKHTGNVSGWKLILLFNNKRYFNLINILL